MNNNYIILGGGAVLLTGAYFMFKDKSSSTISSGALIKARDFIVEKEGFRTKIYKDTAGLDTIGYGHLIKKGENFSSGITKSQAANLLEKDLKIAENSVNNYVKVGLSVNQKAALISFVFNVGVGAFQKSTLLQLLNKGQLSQAVQELDKWVYSGGKLTQGLVNRRKAEKILFLS